MDFGLSPRQQDVQDRAQRLLADRFSTTVVREAENSTDGFPRALWEAGSALGWSGALVAAESGGTGGGLLDLCVLLEETGRSGATLPLVVSSGVAATALARSPQSEHRNRALEAVARGDIVAPVFIDEDGRNEWDAVRLPLRPDGEGIRLSGTKVLVPFASVANELLVTATRPDGGTAFVLVEPASPGVSITRHHAKVGVPLSSIVFDDVAIPDERLIHAGDDALTVRDAALRVGSLLATAEAVGMCEALIAMTAAYVSTRQAFGRPIGTFQAVAHPCADMRIGADSIRILVQQAAWMLDNGLPADEEIPATKALANELFEQAANDAYRLHGALGFSNECDVQLFMRRLQGFVGSFGETQESYERAAAAMGL